MYIFLCYILHSILLRSQRGHWATIISTATEYIGQLEKRNKGLTKENKALQARVDAIKSANSALVSRSPTLVSSAMLGIV